MLSIQRLHKRLPLVVFIFLFLLVAMLVGLACACASDHPMQTIERVLASIPAAAPVLEIWTYAFVGFLIVASVALHRPRPSGRASPQELQRFLF